MTSCLYLSNTLVFTYSEKLSVQVCDWTGENTWSCCSEENKCRLHEGDCDSNDECEEGLTCGQDNCKTLNPEKPFPTSATPTTTTSITTAPTTTSGTSGYCGKEF